MDDTVDHATNDRLTALEERVAKLEEGTSQDDDEPGGGPKPGDETEAEQLPADDEELYEPEAS